MKNAVALILGGGRGTRLAPLTSIRSKPAVPLGGMYRLIDIPISNCLNSGINRVFVLTQFMSVSLHNHINNAYQFDNFSGGFVELLAAQETPSAGSDWYQGTADAVRKNLIYFNQSDIEYVVILSGDQLYRMDYSKLIETHIAKGADVTIACLPVTREDAKGFGIMQLDDHGRVSGFVEKPQTDEAMDAVRTDPDWIRTQGIDPEGRDCLASMGIYVFGRELLNKLLEGSTYTDFGKEVFPETIKNFKVYTHLFDDYWEDIGTIRSFYEANLNLASEKPSFQMVQGNRPIYTHARFLPPTKMGDASVKSSLISVGCEIGDGVEIENSVIGLRTKIAPGVKIKNSIIMGAAYYNSERPAEVDTEIPLGIGEGTVIDGAIIDLDCRIGKNVRIINGKNRMETSLDHPTCVIRDGIPILIKKSILPDDWTLDDEV
ncbi:glucose-1-phosphate adenylyltransferase [Mariniblastus fucicola]|uniref:Glucose-1-phosphate adenylyltransferase n=1 Tax=Mariniblastus fucicola TaxID=980251 RepID=A0A5B9P702_9BACT|nr:glucose-1-phosphate adenylyltransferase [Mariniblastus fucicola]QEG20955.1 Glucose-1-phosphate adenylyltransferase [Mariniblastus fucicola]